MSNTIIEINGIKMEVDERNASIRKIEAIKIGTKVKLLIKGDYDSSPKKVCYGVVIGFDPFPTLPTVICCYLESGYTPELKFHYFNSESKSEMVVSDDADDIGILQEEFIVKHIDSNIVELQNKINALEDKKEYFKKNFKQYFKNAL